jgi:hypothetical protein
MRKFVHSYLSASFVVKRTENNQEGKITIFGFDAIFPKTNNLDETSFIYGSKLIKELVLAAYIDEVRLRKYINEWVEVNYPKADLQLYWLQLEPEFPKIQQVAARTIGMDLVQVKPMDVPKGNLAYLDFQYGDEPNKNGRVYDKKVFGEKIAELLRNQVNFMINEQPTKGSPIFISSKKKKDLDNPE